MLYKTLSAAVYGIDASIIEVEVDVSGIKTNEDHFSPLRGSGRWNYRG
jgi:magnesium chelatase family protein